MKIRIPSTGVAALAIVMERGPITCPLFPEVSPAAQVQRETAVSDTKPELGIYKVGPIPESWFYRVQARITRSIIPQGAEAEDDGRWIRQDIADAAVSFFEIASDVLPNEPYIYSSGKGDLIAEYKAAHGTMTNIIKRTQLIAFAVSDSGEPTEKRIDLKKSGAAALRGELRTLTNSIRGGAFGEEVAAT